MDGGDLHRLGIRRPGGTIRQMDSEGGQREGGPEEEAAHEIGHVQMQRAGGPVRNAAKLHRRQAKIANRKPRRGHAHLRGKFDHEI